VARVLQSPANVIALGIVIVAIAGLSLRDNLVVQLLVELCHRGKR